MTNDDRRATRRAMRTLVRPEVRAFIDHCLCELYPAARHHARKIGLTPLEAQEAAARVCKAAVTAMAASVRRLENRQLVGLEKN